MEKTVKKFGRPNLIIALVVLIAVVIGGLYEYNHYHSKSSSSNAAKVATAGWTSYKNTQYGFQFKYPPAWGTVTLHTSQLSGGTSYTASFSKVVKVGDTFASSLISISPDSAAFSGKTIQKQISTAKSPALTDSTSYAQVNNSSQLSLSSINLYQIVNLAKLKATGAVLYYQIAKAPANCPPNKLSDKVGCVTNSDYTTLNAVAKTIQSL